MNSSSKPKIDKIVSAHSFGGKPVEYRGSAQKGERAAAKGKTHFDPGNFDIDAYVVHPELYKKMASRDPGRERFGKIFPRAGDESAPLLVRLCKPGAPS